MILRLECLARSQEHLSKSEILDLVHSDLCDFYSTLLLGNKRYVITFIDDYSKFCYVYLLRTKDKTLCFLKVYKYEVELQVGSELKKLRTNKGGEYYDPSYFQSVVIIHKRTT